ncbi:MAG TPA: acyl carrier protein [Rhodopila sp.]|jgi:acyl carrier protein|nr:acyl carrier protein [Rhodopila sp.]
MTTVMSDVAIQMQEMTLNVLRIEAPIGFLQPDTNLYELGLESLNVVELLTQIEMTFDLTIDVEDLDAALFSRFGNLVDFVEAKIAARG